MNQGLKLLYPLVLEGFPLIGWVFMGPTYAVCGDMGL